MWRGAPQKLFRRFTPGVCPHFQIRSGATGGRRGGAFSANGLGPRPLVSRAIASRLFSSQATSCTSEPAAATTVWDSVGAHVTSAD